MARGADTLSLAADALLLQLFRSPLPAARPGALSLAALPRWRVPSLRTVPERHLRRDARRAGVARTRADFPGAIRSRRRPAKRGEGESFHDRVLLHLHAVARPLRPATPSRGGPRHLPGCRPVFFRRPGARACRDRRTL